MATERNTALRRVLTRPQAADFLGLSLSTFDNWVRQGILPGPIPGTRRWDHAAIQRALDRASGLAFAGQEYRDDTPHDRV